MSIITPIIYPSAAQFWRGGFPTYYGYVFNNRVLADLPSEYKVSAEASLCALERLSLSIPLSLISNNVNRKHVGKYYTTTWQKNTLPSNSFFKIPNFEIYIACPELTFLQAARYLEFIDLVHLGFDLCAQYYSDENASFGQRNRVPVTTPEQIIEYAKNSNHMHGSAKAIRAARYVLAFSNSPMETRLAIMLGLSTRMGGYGLNGIEMNAPIKLSKSGIELVGVREIRGDLVWRKKKFVVEYNSKTVHNNDSTYYNDADRATAFKDSGWQCIVVTPNNIKTFGAMENIARVIRKQLGLPAKKEVLSTYENEREEIFEKLFKER